MPNIQNTEVLSLSIVTYGDDTNTDLNLGSLTLKREGREYVLDAVQSYRTHELGETTIEVKFERDDETFPDCPYNITDADLRSNNLKAEFFFESEEELELLHMTLFVREGGCDGCTRAIKVEEEADHA